MSSSLSSDRLTGLLFLLPMFFYGAGSNFVDAGRWGPGVPLVIANSVTVTAIALHLRPELSRLDGRVSDGYLAGRVAEAGLLIASLYHASKGNAKAKHAYYQAGMIALGISSLPVMRLWGAEGLLPPWFANWGFAGYVGLASGAVAELAGHAVGIAMSIPGGLFEVALGVKLLWSGFNRQ
ncbi:hypothetical protein DFJ74DRAFT_714466 [Hyaloraphidium curvatum]|nr:hypothetical protein DFJ74DRAFT_714466 [Hyaloraphidium curvatum]